MSSRAVAVEGDLLLEQYEAGSAVRLKKAQRLELVRELRRVAFDDHDVVGSASEGVAGVLALGVQGVGGDHDPRELTDR